MHFCLKGDEENFSPSWMILIPYINRNGIIMFEVNPNENKPKSFDKGSIGRQQDFSNCKPERLSQLGVRNCPLRLFLMEFLKHNIECLKPDHTVHIDMSKEVKKLLSLKKVHNKQLKSYRSLTIALEAPLLLPVILSPPTVPLPPPEEVRP